MSHDVKALICQMSVEEKANFCSGVDNWHLFSLPRLNIPEIMVCDGPHGLRKQDETCDQSEINSSVKAICFPTASATACCFNTKLLEEMGQTLGDEALHEKVGIVLGPGCNIKRSPLCGRNFEYYSEDPLVSTKAAASFVKGIQSKNVGACMKHFACNNQEDRRGSISADVDERTLREIYLASFEGAITESHPWSIMCSYNRINGVYSADNEWLLTKVLRDEWKFDGIVMSDWGATNDRVKGCKAGLELQMPGPCNWFNQQIAKSVKEGILDEKILNRCAERVVDVIFRAVDGQAQGNFDYEEHHKIAQKVGEECVVLLKNENHILPLNKTQKVAFIGPYAKNPRFQGGGSSHINTYKVTNAFESASKNEANVIFAQGCDDETDDVNQKLLNEAIEIAKSVDAVVLFIGLPDSFESEGYDRKHIHLPKCQNKLVNEVSNVNKNIVVVLHNGSPVDMPWIKEVKGVIEAYLCGEAVGEVIFNILYGIVNPSGHLAETFPLKLEDNPSFLDFGGHHDHVHYREGIFVGYRYYDHKQMDVLFPFGHGLTYTEFAFNNLKIDKDKIKDNEAIYAHVDIKNVGSVEGKCVVQLYVSDKTNYEYRPIKELCAFDKINLKPGETKTVDFKLSKRSFAFWNTEIHDWYVPTGEYEIMIGESSRDIRITGKIQVQSTTTINKTITINTVYGEVYNNPITRPLIENFLNKHPEPKKIMESNDPEHELVRVMIRSFPLRLLISFFAIDPDEVIKIAEDANKLLAS
ncbi:hypothetical protein M9Y10_003151 [Tritrichomonas musculus]|uniref:beta-glucosidase n=1 Tax=Tritrichomonas musculus TaxID=1915356 RepID=A0ABR2JQ00_9EUKA